MELNHLRVFYEVAKIGRFMEASRRLGISQSALSRSVALLEESEGVKLFERSKKGVALTRVGNEVYLHCEKLFQTVNQIQEACRGSKKVCEGPLRFATPDHVINDLLIQPLQQFRHQYPSVVPSVSIGTPDEIIEKVVNKDCEFALLFARVAAPQVEYISLREETMTLVVHSDLWRENKGINQAVTLNRILDKVGYISSVGAQNKRVSNQLLVEVFGKVPKIGVEVNGQEAQKRFCLNRGGIAYLARFMVEAEIRSGQLFEISLPDPHIFSLWLAMRKEHVMSLPAKMFVERLKISWPSAVGMKAV